MNHLKKYYCLLSFIITTAVCHGQQVNFITQGNLRTVFDLAKAQNKKADSTAAAATLKSLLSVCKNVDFADPKTTKLGTFYKAAPSIIYRGSDKKKGMERFCKLF